jgi:HD-GYP domain-containing protein (c-di-GMP phosphodiesterase class II)
LLDHHEYIDGTGYPHGLKGSEIPDLVRMVTIADVYSALIEERSYKTSLPEATAYAILLTVAGKLDSDLVREFRTALKIG